MLLFFLLFGLILHCASMILTIKLVLYAKQQLRFRSIASGGLSMTTHDSSRTIEISDPDLAMPAEINGNRKFRTSKFPFTHQSLPEETMYILDGTAMLYYAHYSKENRDDRSLTSFLSPSLSAQILKKMDEDAVEALTLQQKLQWQESKELGLDLSMSSFGLRPVHSHTVNEINVEMYKIPCGPLTTMIFHFVRFIRDVNPRYIVMAFDVPREDTFRKKLYENYKKSRKKSPVELIALFPIVPHVMESLGCRCLSQSGYEADDLMASMGNWARSRGLNVVHVSQDKDMKQLVDYGVHVMHPFSKEMTGREEVIEKYDLPPEALVDFLAISGDSADGIRGVPGIGPKVAVPLLKYFGSIPNMMKQLHFDTINPVSFEVRDAFYAGDISIKKARELLQQAMNPDDLKDAVLQLSDALQHSNASPLSALARIYLCGIDRLMLYRQLITLKSDLSVEELLESKIADGIKSKLTTDSFRYRGEKTLPAIKSESAISDKTGDEINSTQLLENSLLAVSPSLADPLRLLRELYHKLDQS